MIVKFDNDGEVFADSKLLDFARESVSQNQDVHIANMLAVDAIRAELRRMPVNERPKVKWIFFDKEVHFDENLKSFDAWSDKRTCVSEEIKWELL